MHTHTLKMPFRSAQRQGEGVRTGSKSPATNCLSVLQGRAWSKKWRRMEGKCWKEIKQKDGKPKGMKRTAVYIDGCPQHTRTQTYSRAAISALAAHYCSGYHLSCIPSSYSCSQQRWKTHFAQACICVHWCFAANFDLIWLNMIYTVCNRQPDSLFSPLSFTATEFTVKQQSFCSLAQTPIMRLTIAQSLAMPMRQ